MPHKNVTEVRLVDLPRHAQADGELVVIEEGKAISFTAVRVFLVRAREGAIRGRHAHKECAQFLVCAHGAIDVECDDGTNKRTFRLDEPQKGLLIPPSIWASETYVSADSVLSVLCDRHYDADDYIRDYQQFLAWREGDG